MYEHDSFFTLSIAGQIGLVMISFALALVIFLVFWALTRRRNVYLKIGLSIFVIWLFVWLSPQIYYTYYLFLFDDIPVQNVIKSPPSLSKMGALLTFTDRANFSNHAKGILFWILIAISLLGEKSERRA